MKCNWNFISAGVLWILVILLQNVQGQTDNSTLIWCTVSKEEQEKCTNFSLWVKEDRAYFEPQYFQLNCTHASNKDECMSYLVEEKAQLTTLDPGEVFSAGRYYSLVPIMKEIYDNRLNYQYAVAVIKKNTLQDVTSLHNLRGKKACFPGVGMLGGWVIPINQLMKHGGMEVLDCNNHVKSTIKYFGPSCAVNSLIDKFNPLGDNSDQLCKLCIGKIPGGKCTPTDPYFGYEGAFRCLSEVGDVAFLVHTTVYEMTAKLYESSLHSKDDYELLCLDGTRRPIDDYRFCNWGEIPSRAIVTSSATSLYLRNLYQKFLVKAARRYSSDRSNSTFNFNSRDGREYSTANNNTNYDGRFNSEVNNPSGFNKYDNRNEYDNPINNYNNNNNFENRDEYGRNNSDQRNWDNFGQSDRTNVNYYSGNSYTTEIPISRAPGNFNLFESSPRYGNKHNLLFSDAARDFMSFTENSQLYTEYLGKSLNSIMALRHCPVNVMRLCVTSEPEYEKCDKMKKALAAQLLKPSLSCRKSYSHIHCMREIEEGVSDVTVLDASDIYTAGSRFNLIPFISEVYNLGSPEYYVVAVAKQDDPDTDLTYLKNKNTCHTGINTAAGWVYPLSYLLTNRWMRGYGCDSVRAAAEYFTKSCIPGALSPEYNIGVPYDHMCHLCRGTTSSNCRRDHAEDYYGYTGAFRCLVEAGGDVAFVKHTTVAENTDGKRKETWARNTFARDFQLLCPDGTRRSTFEYEQCNLGKVAANAIVTRGGESYSEAEVNAYINLFVYAQQFYGRKEQDYFTFSMFYSNPPYSDLIFLDATQQLVVVPKEKRGYREYLGPDFLRARRIVDCTAGAAALSYSLTGTFFMIIFTIIFSR